MQLKVTRYARDGRGGGQAGLPSPAAFCPSVIERAKPRLHSLRNGSRAHGDLVYDFVVSP